MGGFGSTRWEDHVRARPVEACLPLRCARMDWRRVFEAEPGEWLRVKPELFEQMRPPGLEAVRPTESRPAPGALDVRFRPFDPQRGHPFFNGRPGPPAVQRVQLLTTRPHFGGVRYWMECPACEGRKGVLWLPPPASRFRCRECYELTYRSAQRSGLEEARWRTPEATRERMRRYLREAGYDPAEAFGGRYSEAEAGGA